MDDEEAALIAVSALFLGYAVMEETKKKRKPRKVWVKPWILQRETLGAYNALVSEIALSEREDYRRFMRMNTETFTEILERINPYITKKTTVMRLITGAGNDNPSSLPLIAPVSLFL